MAFERNFALGFGWRLLSLLVAVAALAFTLWEPDLHAARVVAGALVAGTIWGLWHYIGRTNRELARFVEGLRYGDFNQGFSRVGGRLQRAWPGPGRCDAPASRRARTSQ